MKTMSKEDFLGVIDSLIQDSVLEESVVAKGDKFVFGSMGTGRVDFEPYVCKDGPVFNLAEIKDLPEAFT